LGVLRSDLRFAGPAAYRDKVCGLCAVTGAPLQSGSAFGSTRRILKVQPFSPRIKTRIIRRRFFKDQYFNSAKQFNTTNCLF
jgi:hypothetical protein